MSTKTLRRVNYFGLFLSITIFLFGITTNAQSSWNSQDWGYRRAITVSNSSGNVLNNYQFKVTLNNSFDFSRCKIDGSDIRFTSDDSQTLIPYWFEEWNPAGNSATIWVKVPTIPTTGTTIYQYYGNLNATFPTTSAPTTVDLPPTGPWTNIAGVTVNGRNGGLLAENMVEENGTYWQLFSDRNFCNAQLGLAKNISSDPGNASGWNWNGNLIIDFSNRSSNTAFAGDPRLNGTEGNILDPYLDSPHIVKGDDGYWYLFYHWIVGGDPHGSCGVNGTWSWTVGSYAEIGMARAISITGPYTEVDPFILKSSAREGDNDAWDWARVSEPYVFKRDDGKWIMLFMGDKGNFDDKGNPNIYYIEQCSYATADNITGPYTKWQGGHVPFIPYGPPGSLDAGTIADAHPVKFGNTYYIFYAASPSTFGWSTMYLTTTDWENVTKSTSYVYTNEGNSPFRGAISKFNNTYYFSYLGSSGSSSGPFMITTQPATGTIPGQSLYGTDAVFDFYDGFDGNTLDRSKWNGSGTDVDPGYTGTATVSNGELVITNSGGFISELSAKQLFGIGKMFEARAKHSSTGFAGEIGFGRLESGAAWSGPPYGFKNQRIMDLRAINGSDFVIDADNADHVESPGDYVVTSIPLDFTNYLVHKVMRVDNNNVKFQLDNLPITTISNTPDRPNRVSSDPLGPWFFMLGGSSMNVDWLRVRGYADPEPTFSIGAEGQLPPAIPTLISPNDLAVNVPTQIELKWNSVSRADNYTLQVARDAGFTDKFIPDQTLTGISYNITGLSNNTTYYWRVSANNPGGSIGFSTFRRFTTIIILPAAPTLISPNDFAGGVSIEPTLTWSSVSGAATYTLRVARDQNFTDVVFSDETLTSTSHTTTGLTNSTTYYWHVRANNSSGSSGFSETRSFTTVSAAVPILSWPIGSATVYTTTVTFSWYVNTGGSGLKYDLLYSTNSDMSSPTIITGLTLNTLTASGFLSGKTYYWQVRTKTSSGAISAYSTIENFKIIAQNPGAVKPIPSWPIGGVTVYTNFPTLCWYLMSAGTGLTYEIEIGTGPLNGTPTYTVTCMNITLTGLSSGITYFWRVRSTNGSAYSDWSNTESFNTVNVVTGPVKPIPAWPIGGAFVYTNYPTLSWYIGTLRPGLKYEVEYGTGPLTGTPNILGISSFNTNLTGLTSGTTYFWRVRSTDEITYSDWSELASFKTISGSSTVSTPVPTWPIGSTTVYTNSPTLYWYVSGSSIGLTYEVQYATNALMSDLTTISSLSSMSAVLTGLSNGVTYYWRVRSFDGTLYSYSPIVSFTISAGNACVIPMPASPIAEVNVGTVSPMLSWSLPTATETLIYELQYSKNPEMINAKVIDNVANPYLSLKGLESGTIYYWRIKSKASDGKTSEYSSVESFNTGNITSTEIIENIPTRFSLKQNYPNPFNPSTTIEFGIPSAGNYVLKVFNVLGQAVRILAYKNFSAGFHKVTFDASSLTSGIYFYQLFGNEVNLIRKMMLIK
jgi:hypothetical protein